MKKQSKAFEIALSAVSCALATIFLTLGVLNPYVMTAGYLIACFALMLPLTKELWLGDALSYVATVILTLLFGGLAFFWRLLPFILFFGLHPLVNRLQIKYKINVWLAYFIKAIWFDVALYLTWRFVFDMTTNFAFFDEYALPLIFVGGTIVFYLYDRAMFSCQRSIDRIIRKIKKD